MEISFSFDDTNKLPVQINRFAHRSLYMRKEARMFQTIMIGITDTNPQTYIVQQAACIAKKMQAKLLVYYPFSMNTVETEAGFVDPLNWSLKRTEAETVMKQVIEQLHQQGLEAEGEVIEGTSIESFMAYAHKNNVSMIILEKSNNDLLHELMISSAIPVLSLPKSYSKSPVSECFSRILLPLDGSKRAEVALPFAAALSEKLGTEVLLAHVVQPPSFTRSGNFNDDKINQLSEQVVETNRQNAQSYLRQVVERFSVPAYSQVIINNDVASSIHQVIEDESIDLVILSAHGASGNQQWPYGSIANNLIAYSLAPVFLVQDLPAMQADEPNMLSNQRRFTHR
jgi:nucleotide-binding universal stress UspA family protein